MDFLIKLMTITNVDLVVESFR